MIVNPATAQEKHLGNIDYTVLQPGDVLHIHSAGGGGRGNPLEREPWRVAEDIARGYVSILAAERDYGVVMAAGVVDETATSAQRAKLSEHQSAEHFHFGPERDEFERVWTAEAYGQMTQLLAELPVHWRFFVKTELFARLGGSAGTLQEAFEQVCTRFPQLLNVASKTQH